MYISTMAIYLLEHLKEKTVHNPFPSLELILRSVMFTLISCNSVGVKCIALI